jgi:two-component system KDP operon response regulator KdpE
MTSSGPLPLVLVVEDELAVRRVLSTSLPAHGFRVVEAEDGASALRQAEQRPDRVLLDLGLPDGDGLELVRQLRAWTAVPIIVLSARGREEDKVAALDAGADDYLTKPFALSCSRGMRAAVRGAVARVLPAWARSSPGDPEWRVRAAGTR